MAPDTNPPPFIQDMARDWRTPDGARPTNAQASKHGDLYVTFDAPVKTRSHYGSDYTYISGQELAFDSDGHHTYSDLQLIYDPLCLDCGQPLADHEDDSDDTLIYGVITPPGFDTVEATFDFQTAMGTAERLAERNPGHNFDVVAVARVASVSAETTVFTTYH